MRGSLEANFARIHHDNIEAQRRRWLEVRDAADDLLAFLSDGSEPSAAEKRLKAAVDAVRGAWLM